jgi:hypothetical protein
MPKMVYGVAVISACLWTALPWGRVHAQAPSRTPTSPSCTAAKNLSLVRAWSTDKINVAENIPRQECRFTVNDVPPSGQAAAQMVKAWDSLLRADGTALASFPGDLALVLGSAPSDDTAAGLRSAIAKQAAPLRECFAARAHRAGFEFSSADVVCVSSRDSFKGLVRVGRSLGVEFETAAPHLRMGVSSGDTAHYLFIPAATQ